MSRKLIICSPSREIKIPISKSEYMFYKAYNDYDGKIVDFILK